MNKKRILIAEPDGFSRKALLCLEQVCDVECRAVSQSEMIHALAHYDAVWVRLHRCVTDVDIPPAPLCRYIVTATTGIDHVSAASLAGMEIVSLRGHDEFLKTIHATAELTLGLMLAVIRNIPSAVNSVTRGQWARDHFRGRELCGMTAGIVGYGRLGRRVAHYLSAMGVHVLAYDPYVAIEDVEHVSDLHDLLGRSDVVSVHVKLDDTTEAMVDAGWFASMKKGSYLINTARGQVVDEAALLEALKKGNIAGAAVDVLRGEPNIDAGHPLVAYANQGGNLIITPHLGGATYDSLERCETYLAEVFSQLVSGGAGRS